MKQSAWSYIKPHLKRIIPITFYSLLVIFLVVYLLRIDYSQLQAVDFHWGFFALATIIGLIFRYWGAYIWTILLRSLGAVKVRLTGPIAYVYGKSWLARYIPGTAPWILSKIYFASQHGISKNKLAVSSLLEGVLQIIVQLLFALSLLAFDPRLDIITGNIKLLIVAAALACAAFLLPPIFNWSIGLVYRLFKRKAFDPDHHATIGTIGKGFGLYIIGTFMSSLSLFFIAKAVYPDLGFDELLFVMGAGTLAGAVSMLAVFAPGGIGVREGIQLALLSLIMPTEIAFVITVVTRLWSVGVDLLFFAVTKLGATWRQAPKA